MARTTNGSATSAWAIGMIHHEVRRSSRCVSNTMRNPKPTVTAETPSGSTTTSSVARATRLGRRWRVSALAKHTPSPTAITVATHAIFTDVASACSEELGAPSGVSVRCAYPYAPWANDRPTSSNNGTATSAPSGASASPARVHARGPRTACGAGGRRVTRRTRPPITPATDNATTAATSWRIESAAAVRRSSSCAVCR